MEDQPPSSSPGREAAGPPGRRGSPSRTASTASPSGGGGGMPRRPRKRRRRATDEDRPASAAAGVDDCDKNDRNADADSNDENDSDDENDSNDNDDAEEAGDRRSRRPPTEDPLRRPPDSRDGAEPGGAAVPNACEPCAAANGARPPGCEAVFRVTRTRGRGLATGGFGFVVVSDEDANCRRRPDEREDGEGSSDHGGDRPAAIGPEGGSEDSGARGGGRSVGTRGSGSANVPSPAPAACNEYLFLEEVLFLHERGLLECHAPRDPGDVFSSKQLYGLLRSPTSRNGNDSSSSSSRASSGLSLPVYLVYAHLRRQGFRVVRHTPGRRDLLEQMRLLDREEGPAPPPCPHLRRALRKDAASALAAPLESLAWDVYPPDARFRRSAPGLPLFCAAAASFATPMRWETLRALVRDCRGTPLQIGTVSDAGQVIMFGIHDFRAPDIPHATT